MSARVCLVVDDEPAIRMYLCVILQRTGIQTLEAENAVEALRVLRRFGGEIDLLISDIHMPGDMDGLDLAYVVRNLYSRLPVILISGDVEIAPRDFTFIRKPFRAEAILNAIDQIRSDLCEQANITG